MIQLGFSLSRWNMWLLRDKDRLLLLLARPLHNCVMYPSRGRIRSLGEFKTRERKRRCFHLNMFLLNERVLNLPYKHTYIPTYIHGVQISPAKFRHKFRVGIPLPGAKNRIATFLKYMNLAKTFFNWIRKKSWDLVEFRWRWRWKNSRGLFFRLSDPTPLLDCSRPLLLQLRISSVQLPFFVLSPRPI